MTGIPDDAPGRSLTLSRADDPALPHLGVAGGTYTILLTGRDTAGRYCMIDMYVPPGGGPPPHRHDFEESFTVLEGEIDATFRGAKETVRAGQVINIPANAPHQFRNNSEMPARLLCICSPAGQEDYFLEIGVPVATRTTLPPKPDAAAEPIDRDSLTDYVAEQMVAAGFNPADGRHGLGTAFQTFAQSWRGLAASPRDPALAQTVIESGGALAGTVRSLSAGVEALAARMGGDVTAGLQGLNQTLVEIHHENRTIATRAALDQPSDDEETRRDALVAKVVEATGANVFPRDNRGVALYTAGGQVLLDGRPSQFTSTAATGPAPAEDPRAEAKRLLCSHALIEGEAVPL